MFNVIDNLLLPPDELASVSVRLHTHNTFSVYCGFTTYTSCFTNPHSHAATCSSCTPHTRTGRSAKAGAWSVAAAAVYTEGSCDCLDSCRGTWAIPHGISAAASARCSLGCKAECSLGCKDAVNYRSCCRRVQLSSVCAVATTWSLPTHLLYSYAMHCLLVWLGFGLCAAAQPATGRQCEVLW